MSQLARGCIAPNIATLCICLEMRDWSKSPLAGLQMPTAAFNPGNTQLGLHALTPARLPGLASSRSD